MSSLYGVLKGPVITEKTTSLRTQNRVVTLEVAQWANKFQIRQAIQEQFKVVVDSLRTMVCRGKIKRVGKHMGKQKNWKKAIVQINKESDIDSFGIVDTVAPQEVKE